MNKTVFSFQKQESSKRLVRLLEEGTEIYVPLCPDYVNGGIADGVSSLMISAVNAAREIQRKYSKTSFLFMLADTEGDILTSFDRAPIQVSRDKIVKKVISREIVGSVSLFSEVFIDWHIRQYEFEKKIRLDQEIEYFLSPFREIRRSRYSELYCRHLSLEEAKNLQIRYYAQYLLLCEIMYERNKLVLMNYQTENLRAVTKYHSFLPVRRRLELIVY